MTEEHNLQLNEEKNDIKRRLFLSQEICWHKETVVEPRTVVIEVRREEMVIERRYFSPDLPHQIVKTESTRIPLREERFDICKKPFTLEKVKIYKIRQRYNQSAAVTLKREVMTIRHNHGDMVPVEENQ